MGKDKAEKAQRQAELEAKRAARKADRLARKGEQASDAPAATWTPEGQQALCHLQLHGLTPRQRALLHAASDTVGLQHDSRYDGSERVLHLGTSEQPRVSVGGAAGVSDADVLAACAQHLGLHVPALAQQPGSSRPYKRNAPAPRAAGGELSVAEFVTQCQGQLELEEGEEVARAELELSEYSTAGAQASGRSLLPLRCTDVDSGFLGKTLLTLIYNRGGSVAEPPPLPTHKLSPHDVVAVRPVASARASGADNEKEQSTTQGVVYRVHDTKLVVALDDVDDAAAFDVPLRLDKLANKVTYERYGQVLKDLESSSARLPGLPLLDVAFGSRPPAMADAVPAWRQEGPKALDDTQRAAVDLVLASKDFALIHGPPGTGKTTAVVEAILQDVARGSRVLCCAASNVAVDNVVARLAAASRRVTVVRVGHPARLLPEVLANSLEAHVLRSDSSRLAADCRAEAKQLNRRLLKLGRRDYAERREVRGELRRLAREERQRQSRAVGEVMARAHVVCCTLTGVHGAALRGLEFDAAYVDEAAQALEVATWGALLRARRGVLAGDHLQLPATVLSDAAAKRGLGVSLFERLHGLYGEAAAQMLSVQYRMHASIMAWSSDALYGGRLSAHDTVAAHSLTELTAPPADSEPAADLGAALVLVDTAGCDMEEAQEAEGGSRYNEGESRCVVALAGELLAAGLPAAAVGVITPYSAQRSRLKSALNDAGTGDLEVNTVDGFQGREKEAIIISAVRSNSKHEVGFLADKRRMNVAVTRARRQCVLVCDSETLQGNAFLSGLIDHFQASGAYRSAQEVAP